MKRLLFVILLTIMGCCGVHVQAVGYEKIINPVLPGDRPDPTVIEINGEYWAAATSNEWSPLFPIFKSKDLVNWEYCCNPLEKMSANAEYNLEDIGKYGRLWLRYMEENKPSEYRHMARMGQLKKQAEAINEEAYERLDNIEETWLKKHMTCKKKTFMEQLYLRNQARAMAEEIVINEIVFKCR